MLTETLNLFFYLFIFLHLFIENENIIEFDFTFSAHIKKLILDSFIFQFNIFKNW